MTNRQIPSDPHPFPHEISGHELMAAVRIPPREGEFPNLAVFIGRDPLAPASRAFAVWDAAVRDGEWTFFSGEYDLPYPLAVAEFMSRTASFREHL